MGELIVPGIDMTTGQRKLLGPNDILVDNGGSSFTGFHYFVANAVPFSAVINVLTHFSMPPNLLIPADTAGFYSNTAGGITVRRGGGSEDVFATGRRYIQIPASLDGRLMRFAGRTTMGTAGAGGGGGALIIYQFSHELSVGAYPELQKWESIGLSGTILQANINVVSMPVRVTAGQYFTCAIINRDSTQSIAVSDSASVYWGWTID